MSTLEVSVIIPTFRDPRGVAQCLAGLRNQTYCRDKFEVILVNNDPSQDIDELNLPVNCRVILEKKPGSYAARNTGVRQAKGEILAFTDSDCVPDREWVEVCVRKMKDSAIDRVAGTIVAETRSLTSAGLYDAVFGIDQKAYVAGGVAATANLVVRRDLFQRVGWFNEDLFSGGDFDWNRRATEAGASIMFSQQLQVTHRARNTLTEVLRKNKRVTSGNYMNNTAFRISMMRAILPPIQDFKRLRKMYHLSAREKGQILLVSYLLKIHRAACLALLRAGLIKPQRQ